MLSHSCECSYAHLSLQLVGKVTKLAPWIEVQASLRWRRMEGWRGAGGKTGGKGGLGRGKLLGPRGHCSGWPSEHLR